tara:strand:- start:797 stop:919 length:123 start_codon:yes stop_codon:yes gene_type:complete
MKKLWCKTYPPKAIEEHIQQVGLFDKFIPFTLLVIQEEEE